MKPLLQAAAVEAEKAARVDGDIDYKFPTDRGLYALRHTADEVAALAGVDYDLISARMGHTSLATTFKHYLNVSQERETQAADAIGGFLANLRPAKVNRRLRHWLSHGPRPHAIDQKRKTLTS